MTIQLFKTKADAEKECRHIKKVMPFAKCKPIKIRFDKRDGPMYGMRGFTFDAKEEKTYYIISETKKEAQSWDLDSKIL